MSDRTAAAPVVTLLVALALVPYVLGVLATPAGMTFLGLVGPYGNDQAFYLGWGPRQALDGHVLFEDKYNGAADRRPVFNLLWLVMGWSARIAGVSVLTAYHVTRVVTSVALLLAAWALVADHLPSTSGRRYALLLMAVASGVGAWRIPLSEWGTGRGFSSLSPEAVTPDLWIVESSVFLTLLGEVVLPAATALLLLCLRAVRDVLWSSRPALHAGLLTLALGLVYPYAVVTVYLVAMAAASVRVAEGRDWRATLRDVAVLVAVSAPPILYDAYLVFSDPRLTTGQALYASPSLARYALGLGVTAWLACAVAAWTARHPGPERFLVAWAGVTLVQIYLPIQVVPFQMQLILGIQAPLAILATLGLLRVTASWGHPARAAALAAVLCAAGATSAFHLLDATGRLAHHLLPEYMRDPTREAIEWLDVHTPAESVVMTSPGLSPYVPVLAGNRVYTGDYAAPTADFARKSALLAWLFGDPSRQARAAATVLRNERMWDPLESTCRHASLSIL